MTMDVRGLSAAVTAHLTHDLAGAVPGDLIDDVVRAVLDEHRAGQDMAPEPLMLEVRRRLECFRRAGSSRRYVVGPRTGASASSRVGESGSTSSS